MHEPLRDTARRLIAAYRAKHGNFGDTDEEIRTMERRVEESIAERLAEDRALWFDMMLTEEDVQILNTWRIDPCR